MDEIKGDRLTPAEAKALMQRYIEPAEKAVDQGRDLRIRLAKGQQVLSLPDLTQPERTAAMERMGVLQEELRKADATASLGLGLAMAYAVAATVLESEQEGSFHPPAGSMLRIQMPGLCDVSIRLDGAISSGPSQ